MGSKSKFEITEEIQELLDDLPPTIVKWGEKGHALYPQWLKMIDGCSNPDDAMFPLLGGRFITVAHKWYVFANFVVDMESSFEMEPSKPAILRKCYLARINLKAGFNAKNAVWVPRSAAVQLQATTLIVDTPFGKPMTLRELEAYLKAHAGEPLPETVEAPKYPIRTYDTITGKLETTVLEYADIVPIPLKALRRRHQLKQCLIRPPRPYGAEVENMRGDMYTPIPDHHFKPLPSDDERRAFGAMVQAGWDKMPPAPSEVVAVPESELWKYK